MHALICVDGERVAEFLTASRELLAPELTWTVLHVVDTRPVEEAERALGGLIGREPARHRAEHHLHHTVEWNETAVQTAIGEWQRQTGQPLHVMLTRGRPEREIIRIADEHTVDLIVLGAGRDTHGRHPGPGPMPLAPVARFVTDHTRCGVLLLR